jgi:glycerol-3-phosphate cytidylyltransferase-like family protein
MHKILLNAVYLDGCLDITFRGFARMIESSNKMALLVSIESVFTILLGSSSRSSQF